MPAPVIPVCAVSIRMYGQDGTPQVNARITAVLNTYEVYQGYVVPEKMSGVTDADGLCVLSLFPNELGSVESSYDIRMVGTRGKVEILRAVVPNVTEVDLENCAVLPPFPGKVDGQLALEAVLVVGQEANQAAIDAVNAADAASGSANTAATIAAASASSETNAENSAVAASGSATAAAGSASSALSSATSASDSAATAAAILASIDLASIVRTTGNQSIGGTKSFTAAIDAQAGIDVPAAQTGNKAPRASEVGALAEAQIAGNYKRSNILGTVSQAAGVPTGAIVERGSNANGEYVRFADGTQICSYRDGTNRAVNAATVVTNLNASASAGDFTFPAAFVAPPDIDWNVWEQDFSSMWASKANDPTATTSGNFRIFCPSSGRNGKGAYTAIGRWF